jgi:arylsulfatase A-like enzyme
VRAAKLTPVRIALIGLVVVAAAVLIVALVGRGGSKEIAERDPEPSFPPATGKPNIVLLVTDDQDLRSFTRRVMPRTFELLVDQGTVFSQNIVPTPQCCPWRAVSLTGQYGHNNGVLSNVPGYPNLKDPENVLPVWLRKAGYTTIQIGKFLNGYRDAVEHPAKPAPGWDEWYASTHEGYYKHSMSHNGELVEYKKDPEDYHTTVVTELALELIEKHGGQDKERPFFLSLDYWAPHKDHKKLKSVRPDGKRCKRAAIPAPEDWDAFADEPLPRPPSFDERDISDKPVMVRRQPRLANADTAVPIEMKFANYQCRLAALQAVDRSVEQIVRKLEELGELEDTIIVFTSDNGFYFGEHRLPSGKSWPYEEGIRTPLVVRAPESIAGPRQPKRVDEIVAAIDLPATIVDWAGAKTCDYEGDCRVLDGRSFAPLLRGRRKAWPRDRAIVLEADETVRTGRRFPCKYQGIRTPRYMLTVHQEIPNASGKCRPGRDVEFYDLKRDPYELENLWRRGGNDRLKRDLLRRYERLRDCSGIKGRDPRPASGHWCE